MGIVKTTFYLASLSLILTTTSFAQSISVLSHPDLNPLAQSNISFNGKSIGATDSRGIFTHTMKIGEISVSYLGYITQTFPSPKRDTTILLLPSSILLSEVIVSPPKEKIMGYFGKWGNGVIYSIPDFNSSVVNSVTISKTTTLRSFLFYIPNFPESKANVPFEFVIFKEINGEYSKTPTIAPLRIAQYEFLWNSYSLEPFNISLEPGNYLFGMRWIKSAMHEDKKNKHIRQPLGTINKGNTEVNSYRSTPNKGWQLLSTSKDGLTNYSIALLGLIVDK